VCSVLFDGYLFPYFVGLKVLLFIVFLNALFLSTQIQLVLEYLDVIFYLIFYSFILCAYIDWAISTPCSPPPPAPPHLPCFQAKPVLPFSQ
jgi:hypothetical protein